MFIAVLSYLVKGFLGLLLMFVLIALIKLYVRHALWRWGYNYSSDHQPKGIWGWTKALVTTTFWLPCDILMFAGFFIVVVIAVILCAVGAAIGYVLFCGISGTKQISSGKERRLECDAIAAMENDWYN